jgi:hypothetical protein
MITSDHSMPRTVLTKQQANDVLRSAWLQRVADYEQEFGGLVRGPVLRIDCRNDFVMMVTSQGTPLKTVIAGLAGIGAGAADYMLSVVKETMSESVSLSEREAPFITEIRPMPDGAAAFIGYHEFGFNISEE